MSHVRASRRPNAPLASPTVVEASLRPKPPNHNLPHQYHLITSTRTMSSSPSELPTSQLPDLPDERYPNLPSASTAASSSGSTSSLSSAPVARDVPTTYLGSISAWWAHKDEEIQVAEERLLRCDLPLQALVRSSRADLHTFPSLRTPDPIPS